MRRELRFKELSIIRVIANLVEAVVKVGFAWGGMPIWCFILGPIARNLVTGIGVLICHPWRPRLVCDVRGAREHVGFGVKISLSQILYHFYTNIDYQVVSFFFGEQKLGIYRGAFELVLYPVKYISEVITSIALSAFARLRLQLSEVVEQFIAFSRQNLVFVSPLLALILIAAEDVLTVFAKTSQEGATAARILCAAGILRGLSHIFPPLLDGVGRPGLTLVYTVVASVVLPFAYVVFALALGDELGFQSVALAWAVAYPLAFVVLAGLGLGRIELGWGRYLRRVIAIPVCAAAAMVPAYLAHRLLRDARPGLRLAVDALVLLVAFAVLLWRVTGISMRSAARSLRGSGPP
jgi:O-antigen/teichoic acid export membrane protein